MEQVGERSEPQDPEQEEAASSPLHPPVAANGPDPPDVADPDAESSGANEGPSEPFASPSKAIPAVAIVAIVVVVGLAGWLISRGEDLGEVGSAPPASTEPRSAVSPSTTPASDPADTAVIVPPATDPPATEPVVTAPPATEPPATEPPATEPPATPAVSAPAGEQIPPAAGDDPGAAPDDDAVVAITDVVPALAAFPEHITDPAALAAEVTVLLASGRHDVASPTPVSTLCAAVPLDGPLDVSGRWQLDGRPLSSSEPRALGPPGFGDCIDNDGDALDDGAYQFIAVDIEGTESAAGTFVAGAARIEQRFRNNGDDAVCAILIGPSSSDYYEAYPFRGPPPVRPGDIVTIPVADVRQDVRTIGCADGEPLSQFSFDPTTADAQDLTP